MFQVSGSVGVKVQRKYPILSLSAGVGQRCGGEAGNEKHETRNAKP
jgi:hypothetical protein